MSTKARLIHMAFGLLIGVAGVILTLVWFGWQLLLVIFLLLWSNNISMGQGK